MNNTSASKAFHLSGYVVASVVALGADLTITLLSAYWLSPVLAASIGFTVGTLVSYLLARRLAVKNTHAASPLDFVGYAAIGLLTLGQCASLVYFLTGIGVALVIAKGVSIPITFLTGLWLRKLWLLRARPIH